MNTNEKVNENKCFELIQSVSIHSFLGAIPLTAGSCVEKVKKKSASVKEFFLKYPKIISRKVNFSIGKVCVWGGGGEKQLLWTLAWSFINAQIKKCKIMLSKAHLPSLPFPNALFSILSQN